MTKQIQRVEIQRDRLLDELENAEGLDEKIKMEKVISDIDSNLIHLFSKMIFNGKLNFTPTEKLEVNEDEIGICQRFDFKRRRS